jgi:3-oxoadipate enol-lactonase
MNDSTGDQTAKRFQGLAYDDVGSGPTVILIHGFPFNRSMWREQVDLLSSSYRVLAPDLRGHGESEATAGTVTMEAMARDVSALMDHVGISRAVVAGLSMGGYVSLALYRIYPLRVRALILADTRAQNDTEEGKKNRELQANKALTEGMEGIANAMLPKLLSPDTVARRADIVRRVREMMVETKPEGAAAALRGMAERRDHRTSLANIIAPTLIIVGREDAITPVADSELMHREIRGSRLEILDGAGHVSNIERADEFNRVLLRFLHDLEA